MNCFTKTFFVRFHVDLKESCLKSYCFEAFVFWELYRLNVHQVMYYMYISHVIKVFCVTGINFRIGGSTDISIKLESFKINFNATVLLDSNDWDNFILTWLYIQHAIKFYLHFTVAHVSLQHKISNHSFVIFIYLVNLHAIISASCFDNICCVL